MNIYACGGTGINQAIAMIKYSNKDNLGFAKLNPFFIDTSTSNCDGSIPEENFYHIEDRDDESLLNGSGKRRDSNYEAIAASRKDILFRFKPADINVVIHSCGGGSGAVIGPVLVSELLERGDKVIVIATGSTSSKIEVRNTLKTLESYQAISHKRKLPIPMYYRENSVDTPRGRVDADVQTALVLIAAMYSGQNRELDMADLSNFLNYPNVTSHMPELAYFDFFSRNIILGKNDILYSVVSLTDEASSSELSELTVEYQANGFVPDNIKAKISTPMPIFAVIQGNVFAGVCSRLTDRLTKYEEIRNSVHIKSVTINADESTDDGLMF
jgi:hypothetical protein